MKFSARKVFFFHWFAFSLFCEGIPFAKTQKCQKIKFDFESISNDLETKSNTINQNADVTKASAEYAKYIVDLSTLLTQTLNNSIQQKCLSQSPLCLQSTREASQAFEATSKAVKVTASIHATPSKTKQEDLEKAYQNTVKHFADFNMAMENIKKHCQYP